MDTTVLRQKNPEVANLVDQWCQRFQGRNFDLNKIEDRADYVEAMTELARHIAMHSAVASMKISINTAGVSSYEGLAIPRFAADAS